MTGPIFQLVGIKKAYNSKQVLHIGSLDIHQGEIFVLVGPSGAGKSTLLRLLNFLETPTEGEIRFQGTQVQPGRAMPLEKRRQVTMVFQRPLLLDRTIWANVNYGLRIRSTQQADLQTAAALDQVGLTSMSQDQARKLSGGEAQRVALARALVLEPKVLLLDEPTANLDPHNVGLIERTVQDLNRDKGTTLVLVTHNVFQARRLADRVALILDGRLVEVADANTFFQAPTDPRTAAFVRGDMIY